MARKVGPLTTNVILRSGMSSGASGKATLPTPDPISHSARKEASCSRCPNRTNEDPPFCTWLNAEIPTDLADDPECEGFPSKNLRTSTRKGSPHIESPKGEKQRRVGELETPIAKPLKTACPKTLDKSLIQTALTFKGFRGSVVMEKICCGKPGCHCQSGALHGPYPYLHYYSNGKVKRRYLSKTVSALLSHSAEELERMFHETDSVLGQEETVKVREVD